MYDNHRDSFGRRRQRPDEERSRESRAYWRDQAWSGDRYLRDDEDGRSDYGRSDWRTDPRQTQQSDFARQQGYRDRHAHDEHLHHHDHDDRYYYAGLDRYTDNREQRTFTGAQNSWAVPPQTGSGSAAYGGSSYAARGYGRDYLDYGHNRDRHERGFFQKAGDEIASWFGDEDAARRREADHRGRGPKDYVRSDDRIRDDVNDRLTEDWRIDASNITVTVDKGEVTLNGTVTERAAKRRAEDIVEDLSGVKHVQNNLRVAEQTTPGAYDDNWALNQRSTAEGGTLGKDTTIAKH